MTRRAWFRWKAVVPLGLLLGGGTLAWWLLLDTLVERTVESVGTAIVGARVDVAEADVRLTQGYVTLRGLAVTNPDQPMTNLFEAEEIVTDLRLGPLVKKKVFIDTVAVRALRFNTPRETSGAIDNPSEASRAVRGQIDAWAERVAIPPFSLGGLGQAVNVNAINADSLRMPGAIRGLGGDLDSVRQRLERTIRTADPTPIVEDARALLDSLRGRSIRQLGVPGAVSAVRDLRALVTRVDTNVAWLAALDDSVTAVGAGARHALSTLDAVRAQDLHYARGLLRIPSLDAPDLAPSLLGAFAVERVRPVLYWLNVAERFIPPGLDPRRRTGPVRARRAGTTVSFPSAGSYPAFSLLFGEAGVTVDRGRAAGEYRATVQNLTTAPAALGRPLLLAADRTGGAAGGPDVGLAGTFDRTGSVARDSGLLRLVGVTLPTISLPGLNTRLDLGRGETRLEFTRTGDSVAGRMRWSSDQVGWTPAGAVDNGLVGMLRSVLESVNTVDVEVRFAGRIDAPRLSVRSNLATVVAGALRARLGEEIARAEASLRAEIDRRIEEPLRTYRVRAEGVQQELTGHIQAYRGQLNQLRSELETRVRELTRGLPPGIPR